MRDNVLSIQQNLHLSEFIFYLNSFLAYFVYDSLNLSLYFCSLFFISLIT